MTSLKSVFMVTIFLICGCLAKEYNVFCQYDLASYYFKERSQFFDWNMDSRLCTHLVVGSGIGVDGDTGKLKITDKPLLLDMLSSVKNMKVDSIKKVLFTVGGWKEESSHFSRMVAAPNMRNNFYTSVIDFMTKWGFDGVQIDWRYPTQQGGYPEDRKNFVLFLEKLSLILREHKFILMVAVSGRTNKRTLESYNIPDIVKNSDFVHLMMHDERDPYRNRLVYNAPLNGDNSVSDAIKHWKTHGMAPEKLILGIPLFVRSFTMDNNQTEVGSPCKGPGLRTKLSHRPGFMTYNEFCVKESNWIRRFDQVAKVPYAMKGDQWVSYENGQSIWAKMHLLQKQKLGGAIAWTIDVDDFHGNCGERHGLLHVIFAALGDKNALTTEEPTTEASGLCPQDGFWRNGWDCRLYHECNDGERIYYECEEGQYFDEEQLICRPAKEVKCDQNFVIWRPGMPVYSLKNMPINLKIVD
ncbi:chitinase-like protein 3 isoform X2 [Drosophila ficusphila]|uniref:chitinase-like protein 3 isoform X2 n=1 Tax=Drosophila ficusphila TaxID=30025 RepID=UPI0007E8076D|nr:chitinase-like protein 3 isoform X2 [Drosophila ficusphila]